MKEFYNLGAKFVCCTLFLYHFGRLSYSLISRVIKISGAVHIPKGMLWNLKQNLITKLLRIYRLFSNDW